MKKKSQTLLILVIILVFICFQLLNLNSIKIHKSKKTLMIKGKKESNELKINRNELKKIIGHKNEDLSDSSLLNLTMDYIIKKELYKLEISDSILYDDYLQRVSNQNVFIPKEDIIWNEEVIFYPKYWTKKFETIEILSKKNRKDLTQDSLSNYINSKEMTMENYINDLKRKNFHDSIICSLILTSLSFNLDENASKKNNDNNPKHLHFLLDKIITESKTLTNYQKATYLLDFAKLSFNEKVYFDIEYYKLISKAKIFVKESPKNFNKITILEINFLNYFNFDFLRKHAIKICEQEIKNTSLNNEEIINLFSELALLYSKELLNKELNEIEINLSEKLDLLYFIITSLGTSNNKEINPHIYSRTNIAISNLFRIEKKYLEAIKFNRNSLKRLFQISDKNLLFLEKEILENSQRTRFLIDKSDNKKTMQVYYLPFNNQITEDEIDVTETNYKIHSQDKLSITYITRQFNKYDGLSIIDKLILKYLLLKQSNIYAENEEFEIAYNLMKKYHITLQKEEVNNYYAFSIGLESIKESAILENKINEKLISYEKELNRNYSIIIFVISFLMIIIVILFIKSNKQRKELHRLNIRLSQSEAKQRNLAQTINQIGHLGPEIVHKVIGELSDKIETKAKETLRNLAIILRKFYDYSNEDYITYQDEYDLIMEYAYLTQIDKNSVEIKKMIQVNYEDFPEVNMPIFVAFNAVQNAFKHGLINQWKPVNVNLINENGFYKMEIVNEKNNKKTESTGTGLKFIGDTLKHWNKDNKKDFLKTNIDEKSNKFVLQYYFK